MSKISPPERGILFNAPNVRAIRDGRKTQTRRVVKPRKDPDVGCELAPCEIAGEVNGGDLRLCPYSPGTRLWVRETWCRPSLAGHLKRPELWLNVGPVEYAADMGIERFPVGGNFTPELRDFRWQPSIFMPRELSRITLEVTDVRVQRPRDIGEDDARAEGVEPLDYFREEHDWEVCRKCGGTRLYTYHSMSGARPDTDCTDCDTHKKRFRILWDSINGKRPGCSWADNPWVFAYTFRSAA